MTGARLGEPQQNGNVIQGRPDLTRWMVVCCCGSPTRAPNLVKKPYFAGLAFSLSAHSQACEPWSTQRDTSQYPMKHRQTSMPWHPFFLPIHHAAEGVIRNPSPPIGSRLRLVRFAHLVSHLLTYTRLCSVHFGNKLHLAMAQCAALRRIMPLNAAPPPKKSDKYARLSPSAFPAFQGKNFGSAACL